MVVSAIHARPRAYALEWAMKVANADDLPFALEPRARFELYPAPRGPAKAVVLFYRVR